MASTGSFYDIQMEDPERRLEQFLQDLSSRALPVPEYVNCRKADQVWLTAFINANMDTLEKTDKYSWLKDLRQLNHQDDAGNCIVKILIDQKYESPWIISQWKAFSEVEVDLTKLRSVGSNHLQDCVHHHPHLSMRAPSNLTSWDAIEEKITGGISIIDQFLGFAGYVPNIARQDDEEFRLLENMNDLISHIMIDDCSASVRFLNNAELDPYTKTRILVEKTISSMNRLLLAIEKYQADKQCCDRLTFLKKVVRSTASTGRIVVVESVTVRFIEVFRLAKTLYALMRVISPPTTPWFPGKVQATVGISMGGTGLPFMGPATAVATAAAENFRQTIKRDTAKDLHKAAVSILMTLAVGYSDAFYTHLLDPSGDVRLDSASAIHEAVEAGALATQFLCLAFQVYVRANTGPLDFPFLEYPLKQITLLGGEGESPDPKRKIFISLQKLTCMDQMIRRPVLVFSESDIMNSGQTLDLVSTPEHLVNMWGTASFIRNTSSRRFRAILIGGGILYPTRSDPNGSWHWSSLEEYTKEMDKEILDVRVDINTRIRIGVVSPNPHCPLQNMNAQENMQDDMQANLKYLSTHEPFWTPKIIQSTF